MQEFPVFTLEEANHALGEVIRITEETIEELKPVQQPWAGLPYKKFNAFAGVAEEDIIRSNWARSIMALGIMPKGFFVVDFQSPDPRTVYCWSYGETVVTHEHKTWETFVDRRLIRHVEDFEKPLPSLLQDILDPLADDLSNEQTLDKMTDETSLDDRPRDDV